ncbi:MAG TPA: tetratricopeptide repeat protein [Symbiobacteriaceae bacterium]|nr:tetratricopeptide repeat protein [Symbiobacteriaceae bacterium]
MKRLLILLLMLLLTGCVKQPAGTSAPPADVPPPLSDPEPAAAGVRDAVARPVETGRFRWQADGGKLCPYPSPGSAGSWRVHTATEPLPGLDGATVRFCQWRGESIQTRWAVYARVDRGVTHLAESQRLGDELDWYDVVTMPGRPGFALVAGLLNHAGQREWTAVAAVLPHSGTAFGEFRAVGSGHLGGTALAPDRARLYTWQGQPASGMEGVVINCLLCPQHQTVAEYTWGENWEPKLAAERRTRLPYLLGNPAALKELPVSPRAQELYGQGLELTRRGELEKAGNVLKAALALDPTFPDAAADLGYTIILRKEWEEALAPLEEAVRIDPLHPGARFNLALALTMLGRYREAREHAIHAVLLQPGREEPRALYEQIRWAMGS